MSIQFRIRDFCHPWSLGRLRTTFERSQWWSQQELEAYQDKRLRRIVTYAFKNVPHYRTLFEKQGLSPSAIQTRADLCKIPILTKNTLRHEWQRLRSTCSVGQELRTSGTSGEPLRLFVDKSANVLEFVHYWRHWSWAGYRLGDRFAELSSHFFLHSPSHGRQPVHVQGLTGRLLLNSLVLGRQRVAEFARAIRGFRPKFLKGIASTLYHFASILRELEENDLRFQAVFSAGEILTKHQRLILEQTFQCKVYDSYGHMERTVAVAECPSGGLHIQPEYGILELVDKVPVTHEFPSQERRYLARVIGTSLHNFAMPLLRYDVGDVMEVAEPEIPCPCGRHFPRVQRILGRREDVVVRPDGQVVTAIFVVFDQLPEVAQGQIVQTDIDRLCIRIVRCPGYSAKSEADLERYLRRFVGQEMSLEFEYLPSGGFQEELGSGKFRMVISLLSRHPGHSDTREPANYLARV